VRTAAAVVLLAMACFAIATAILADWVKGGKRL
jgi:hypothetical protein